MDRNRLFLNCVRTFQPRSVRTGAYVSAYHDARLASCRSSSPFRFHPARNACGGTGTWNVDGLPDDEGSAYLVVDGRVHSDGPWNVSGILSARGRLVDSHRSGCRPAKATRGVGARRYIFGNARPAAGSYD